VTLVKTNEKTDSQRFIELSSVYFYENAAPRVIALKDCSLPTKGPIPGAFPALYGFQSKQDGFMAARAYADKNRLQFTVIDFLVKLDQKQNPLMMKPEDLGQHDFITFHRISRKMVDELKNILEKRLEQDGADFDENDLSKPVQLIMQRPELITAMMNEPGWEHMKVIAYPAKVTISEKPLTIGVVPFRNWNAIQEATCRLNPTIRITLDPPELRKKKVDTAPSARAREKSLRVV